MLCLLWADSTRGGGGGGGAPFSPEKEGGGGGGGRGAPFSPEKEGGGGGGMAPLRTPMLLG